MNRRALVSLFLVAVLSACGGGSSSPNTNASADTQATANAVRDANATVIAQSAPTSPTDTPKPAATSRSGSVATTAPTRPAATSAQTVIGSTALTQTLVGPGRCYVIRYPADWMVDEDQGLASGTSDYCIGGDSIDPTTYTNSSCDNNSYDQIIDLRGPDTESDTDVPPIVSLGYVGATCRSLDGLIKQVQGYGTEGGTGFSQVQYSSAKQRTVAGFPAQCFDRTGTYQRVTPVRGTLCFFTVSDSLFALGWGANPTYLNQAPQVLPAIIASLEIRGYRPG
jgi:hypothetical protein